MPVYKLSKNSVRFPDPSEAEPDGLLALGGDLRPERLIEAYRCGIFPWYSEEHPLLWWSPDPRFILFLEDFHISKSLAKTMKKKRFAITFDKDFEQVIESCAKVRSAMEGTWIVKEMKDAYCQLHMLGVAHSVEAWHNGELAGGLYGVSLGKAFFGESMFFNVPEASKVALAFLVERLVKEQFLFIDCQQETSNLERFGAKPVPRNTFLSLLTTALQYPQDAGSWGLEKGSTL